MSKLTQPGKQRKSDKVNSIFEAAGGLFLLLNVLQVLADKSVAGVSITTVSFFTIWGYWNLYYYKSIQQKFSLVASSLVTLVNTVWLALLIYYKIIGG